MAVFSYISDSKLFKKRLSNPGTTLGFLQRKTITLTSRREDKFREKCCVLYDEMGCKQHG